MCGKFVADVGQNVLDSLLVPSIEQLGHERGYFGVNSYCGDGIFRNKRTGVKYRMRCKSFRCSLCRPLEVKKVIKRAGSFCRDAGWRRMVTVTLAGNKPGHRRNVRKELSADESFVYGNDAWKKVVRMLRRGQKDRRTGRWINRPIPLEYIDFPRTGKDGYWHSHILVSHFIPKEYLFRLCKSCGLGDVTIESFDRHRAMRYIAGEIGYIGRRSREHEWFLPKGKRHYSVTHGVSAVWKNPRSATNMHLLFDEWEYCPSHYVGWFVGPNWSMFLTVSDRGPPESYFGCEVQNPYVWLKP